MESKVLAFVQSRNGVTNRDVATELSINVQRASSLLKRLRDAGSVSVVGGRKGPGRGRPADLFGRVSSSEVVEK